VPSRPTLGYVDRYRVDVRSYSVEAEISPRRSEDVPMFKEVEATFEDGRPEHLPSRLDSLFVFENLEDAKEHLLHRDHEDTQIYRVRVDDQLHRGDMGHAENVATGISRGHRDATIKKHIALYWHGETAPSRRPVREILCPKATVVRVELNREESRRCRSERAKARGWRVRGEPQ
jgi:hypothetical protein